MLLFLIIKNYMKDSPTYKGLFTLGGGGAGRFGTLGAET